MTNVAVIFLGKKILRLNFQTFESDRHMKIWEILQSKVLLQAFNNNATGYGSNDTEDEVTAVTVSLDAAKNSIYKWSLPPICPFFSYSIS